MEPRDIAKWVMVASSVLAPVFGPLPQNPDYVHPAPWGFVTLLVGVGIFSVIFLDAMPQSGSRLLPDGWGSLGFRRFVALCLLAYATSTAVVGLTHPEKNWFFEIPLSISMGMLIAVRFLGAHPPIDGSED